MTLSEAAATNLDLDVVSGWIEKDDAESVTTTIFGMVSELRALDGGPTGRSNEAIAGSARETELLDLYQKEEAAVFNVVVTPDVGNKSHH